MKPKPISSTAWSDKVDAKDRRLARKRKKELKTKIEDAPKTKETDNDIDDIEDDFRALKKMKKGKITQDEFDKRIDLDGFETDSDGNEGNV